LVCLIALVASEKPALVAYKSGQVVDNVTADMAFEFLRDFILLYPFIAVNLSKFVNEILRNGSQIGIFKTVLSGNKLIFH